MTATTGTEHAFEFRQEVRGTGAELEALIREAEAVAKPRTRPRAKPRGKRRRLKRHTTQASDADRSTDANTGGDVTATTGTEHAFEFRQEVPGTGAELEALMREVEAGAKTRTRPRAKPRDKSGRHDHRTITLGTLNVTNLRQRAVLKCDGKFSLRKAIGLAKLRTLAKMATEKGLYDLALQETKLPTGRLNITHEGNRWVLVTQACKDKPYYHGVGILLSPRAATLWEAGGMKCTGDESGRSLEIMLPDVGEQRWQLLPRLTPHRTSGRAVERPSWTRRRTGSTP